MYLQQSTEPTNRASDYKGTVIMSAIAFPTLLQGFQGSQ